MRVFYENCNKSWENMISYDRLSYVKMIGYVIRWYFGVGDRVRNNYSIIERSFFSFFVVLLGFVCVD